MGDLEDVLKKFAKMVGVRKELEALKKRVERLLASAKETK